MNESIWKWHRIIAMLLCLSWVIFVSVVLFSWGRFGESGRVYSGIIVPLYSVGGLSLLPFGLWFSVRTIPKRDWFLIMNTVLFGLIAAWLLILVSNYSRPYGWTCIDRATNYLSALMGLSFVAFLLYITTLSKLFLEDHTVSESKLLLTQVGVLSLYTTPWITGLHCGFFGYQGDFVIGGILFYFMVTCTPTLIFLGNAGLSRWSQMAFLPRTSTIMALVVGGSSCVFCSLMVSIIVINR